MNWKEPKWGAGDGENSIITQLRLNVVKQESGPGVATTSNFSFDKR